MEEILWGENIPERILFQENFQDIRLQISLDLASIPWGKETSCT